MKFLRSQKKQNVTRSDKMWQDVTRCDKMWQDVTRCDKMWQNVSKFDNLLGIDSMWQEIKSKNISDLNNYIVYASARYDLNIIKQVGGGKLKKIEPKIKNNYQLEQWKSAVCNKKLF
jgi:hypothetical protein